MDRSFVERTHNAKAIALLLEVQFSKHVIVAHYISRDILASFIERNNSYFYENMCIIRHIVATRNIGVVNVCQ